MHLFAIIFWVFRSAAFAMKCSEGFSSFDRVMQAEVHVDKSNSGKETSEAFEGGTIPLPLKGVRCSCLELNILFDHSLIEVFALGGRARIASRVYPEDISMKPAWEIELFGSVGLQGVVTGSATSWEMHASMKGP